MLAPIVARRDPTLRARITRERQLVYDPSTGHGPVRAGSGLAWSDGKMVLVQDDADMIAIVEGEAASVVAVPLRGPSGSRLGAGPGKGGGELRLEAMVAARDWRGEFFLAFGSGATPDRRRVARVRLHGGDTEMALIDARNLYNKLDELEGFATSQIDIEGAALVHIDGGDFVRLFQRGHGPPRGEGGGLPATVDMRLEPLLTYLERARKEPGSYCAVELENLRRYDLGTIAGVPVGFTDAAALPSGRVVFVGTAEVGLESGEEGEVICSVLGVIEPDGQARYNLLVEADGEPTMRRAEGLAVVDEHRAWVVIDQSDPSHPALLCDVAIDKL